MKPVVISIGGWDPCGGAGLAADIKTFEMNGVAGMGVCSSITCQTHTRFDMLEWTELSLIQSQLLPLLSAYDVKAIKFGIMPDLETILAVIQLVKVKFPEVMVVWDPVLRASAGYHFHRELKVHLLNRLLQQVTLVTPNVHEARWLFGQEHPNDEALQQLLKFNGWGAILLKGGHADHHADDVLITHNTIERLPGQRFPDDAAKHGSGCVLSAAITANLAKGYLINEACHNGKQYVEGFLLSSAGLLGYHVVN